MAKFVLLFVSLCLFLGFSKAKLGPKEKNVGSKILYINDNSKASWYQANKICNKKGYRLLTINSADEFNNLKQYLATNDLLRQSFIWTSGTDLGSEGSFYWMPTGKDLNFSVWKKGNPDNDEDIEHCIHLSSYKYNHAFNDFDCDEKTYFICEKPV